MADTDRKTRARTYMQFAIQAGLAAGLIVAIPYATYAVSDSLDGNDDVPVDVPNHNLPSSIDADKPKPNTEDTSAQNNRVEMNIQSTGQTDIDMQSSQHVEFRIESKQEVRTESSGESSGKSAGSTSLQVNGQPIEIPEGERVNERIKLQDENGDVDIRIRTKQNQDGTGSSTSSTQMEIKTEGWSSE